MLLLKKQATKQYFHATPLWAAIHALKIHDVENKPVSSSMIVPFGQILGGLAELIHCHVADHSTYANRLETRYSC